MFYWPVPFNSKNVRVKYKYLRSIGTSERSIKEAKDWIKAQKKPKAAAKKKKRKGKCKPVVKPQIESYGETMITTFLNLHKIEYKTEKIFGGCVNSKGNMLRYDFYLVKENVLIEYDGAHHFGVTSYSKDFEVVKEHDRIKDEYAAKNGMPLIRLMHKDLENLQDIVFTVLDSLTEQ